MEWLSEIRKLRENVPVGMQAARRLLEKTSGDVDEAIKLFHIDQINILTAKADVTHQEAENVLLVTNYDIAEALRRIDEQRYTLTELIIRKNKDAGDALSKIELAIAYEWNLTCQFWFGFKAFQSLPPQLQAFMLVCEWRNYWGWEGLDSALYYDMDNVPQQFQVVGLDEMAEVIVVARNRYDELRAQGKDHNNIIKDNKLKKIMKHCDQLDSEADAILLQYVKDNIEVFPCRHNGHDL